MKQPNWVIVAGLAIAAVVHAQEVGQLPIKRVVLYKNGVGYFEHVGKVNNNQEVKVAFTSGQLNDVLKSLTVLDLHGGRVAGVNYGSEGPLERQLQDLRLPVGEKTTLTDFLGGLRGAKLEIRSGPNTATGRLLSVERKARMGAGTTLEVDYVSLITENGEVRTVELSSGYSVKLLEAGLTGKVGRYLNLLSSSREADVKQMVIATAGTGERSLFVSYISEVPVWKTTYRLVLPEKSTGKSGTEKPLLQGWAIVDNTVGEDWKNVELSLVAGAPQSFIQKLGQPYYARRPEVPLPDAYNPSPQTYQATLMAGGARLAGMVTDPVGAAVGGARVKVLDHGGTVLGETNSNAIGRYEIVGLPEGVLRVEVEAPGFKKTIVNGVRLSAGQTSAANARLEIGMVTETVEVRASAPDVQTLSADRSSRYDSGRMLGSGAGLGRGLEAVWAPAEGMGFGPGEGGGVGGGVYRVASGIPARAMAQELGDLFEYKVKEPISIPKNRRRRLHHCADLPPSSSWCKKGRTYRRSCTLRALDF